MGLMKSRVAGKNFRIRYVGMALALAGLAVTVLWLWLMLLSPKTKGTQVSWDYYRAGRRIVYVYEYEVGGQTYKYTVNKPSKSRAPADTVTVHYLKAKPSVNQSDASLPMGLMMLVFGVLTVIGDSKKRE